MAIRNTPARVRALLRDRSVFSAAGCWIWSGSASDSGYGTVILEGRYMGTHRASYLVFVGPIPDGLVVRHRCDTKLCVNPEHLQLGTHADNTHDAVERGRNTKGETHGMRKLNVRDIDSIRDLYAGGMAQGAIGRRFGVSQTQISRIVRHERWRGDVPPPSHLTWKDQ